MSSARGLEGATREGDFADSGSVDQLETRVEKTSRGQGLQGLRGTSAGEDDAYQAWAFGERQGRA